jgi:hypothetical protein
LLSQKKKGADFLQKHHASPAFFPAFFLKRISCFAAKKIHPKT